MKKYIFLSLFLFGCSSKDLATDEAHNWVVNMSGTVNNISCNGYDSELVFLYKYIKI